MLLTINVPFIILAVNVVLIGTLTSSPVFSISSPQMVAELCAHLSIQYEYPSIRKNLGMKGWRHVGVDILSLSLLDRVRKRSCGYDIVNYLETYGVDWKSLCCAGPAKFRVGLPGNAAEGHKEVALSALPVWTYSPVKIWSRFREVAQLSLDVSCVLNTCNSNSDSLSAIQSQKKKYGRKLKITTRN